MRGKRLRRRSGELLRADGPLLCAQAVVDQSCRFRNSDTDHHPELWPPMVHAIWGGGEATSKKERGSRNGLSAAELRQGTA
uniref:Uncharacterized protein n=1 Tax=Setaria viridis TaxID=4556 RepID=A0A4U6UW19_SETVI|nr:hypothetical protein SEVIR_5G462850v2 [Setaria viridis]